MDNKIDSLQSIEQLRNTLSDIDNEDHSEPSIDELPKIICDLYSKGPVTNRAKIHELFGRCINSGKIIRWPAKHKDIYERLVQEISSEQITKQIETKVQALSKLSLEKTLTLDQVSGAINEINDLLKNPHLSYGKQCVLEEINVRFQTKKMDLEAIKSPNTQRGIAYQTPTPGSTNTDDVPLSYSPTPSAPARHPATPRLQVNLLDAMNESEKDQNNHQSSLPKPFVASPIIDDWNKAWGFFNNIDGRMAPRYIRPLPSRYIADSDTGKLLFSCHWRFDVLRPLYDGYSDYLREFGLLFASVFLVPLIIIKLTDLLVNDDRSNAYDLLLWFLPAIIWAAVMTVISFTFSLLGLVTRPIMTALLGTNDPDLILTIEGTFSESEVVTHQDEYLVSLKMTLSKDGHEVQHLRDQKMFVEKQLYNDMQNLIIDHAIDYVSHEQCYFKNDKAIFNKMSERAIFSR